jgi:hypothetical protein
MATRKRRTYRVVAVSLYEPQAREADRLTDILMRAGWPKANRSLIVREALMLLEEALAGKHEEAVFRYFVDRHARRVGPSAASPDASPQTDPDRTPERRAPRDLLDLSERKH